MRNDNVVEIAICELSSDEFVERSKFYIEGIGIAGVDLRAIGVDLG